jgi:hypothetical protein
MIEHATPYDVIFAAPGFDEARFEQLRGEDGGRATSPSELLMLPVAGELLRELMPADVEGTPHTALVAQVGALLFHAYRFWLDGRRVWRITAEQLEPLLAGVVPPDGWTFRAPAQAGYVQLPRNALWARVQEDAAAEPVDGFFWSAPAAEQEGAASPLRLDLLLALGVRQGRPGVSLVDVAVDAPVGLEQWARADARPGGDDFANVLPGGELQGYHSLTTHAEVLKLVVLCFWQIDGAADG